MKWFAVKVGNFSWMFKRKRELAKRVSEWITEWINDWINDWINVCKHSKHYAWLAVQWCVSDEVCALKWWQQVIKPEKVKQLNVPCHLITGNADFTSQFLRKIKGTNCVTWMTAKLHYEKKEKNTWLKDKLEYKRIISSKMEVGMIKFLFFLRFKYSKIKN